MFDNKNKTNDTDATWPYTQTYKSLQNYSVIAGILHVKRTFRGTITLPHENVEGFI